MPISVKTLLSLSGTPGAYDRGADYCRRNKVTIAAAKDDIVVASVKGSGGMRYSVVVRYTHDGTGLENFHCDCAAFEQYDGICKHIVATVLEHQKTTAPERRKVPVRDQAIPHTDRVAVSLLNRSARKIAELSLYPYPGAARLEATLETDDTGACLSFKVGADRLYVVRNVEKFRDSFKSGETTAYGKNYSLRHHPSAFLDESLPLLQFLLRSYNDAAQTAEANRRFYGYGNGKRYMYLDPHMLDEFVAIMADRELPLVSDGKNISARVVSGDYRPELTLSRGEMGFALESTKRFRVLQGHEGMFVLDGDELFACGSDFAEACGELLSALERGSFLLRFSEDDITALYTTVLNPAAAFIELDAEEGLEAYQPPPLETKVYLSTEDEDSVTARMTFTYGDKTHDAFVEKDLRASHDLAGEYLAESMLARYFSDGPDVYAYVHIKSDPDAVYTLASEGVEELSRIAEIFASDDFKKLRVHPSAGVRVGVRVESSLLHLDFELDGVDLTELAEILASYRRSKKYHRLRDGSFLALEEGSLTRLAQLADGLDLDSSQLASGHAELAVNRALYLDAMLKRAEDIRYDRDAAFKSIVRGMRDVADADFEVPEELRSVLRNYQKTGYRWLRTVDAYGFGGILADDMGLGKTLQVLALLLACRDKREKRLPSIVVCPASLTLGWENEAQRFTPDLRAEALTGSASERSDVISRVGELDLIITSYDQLKRDIALYEDVEFSFVVTDEAQFIKNPGTQNAKSVKLLRGRTRIALTGTPVENSLAELWSIYDFLMPGYLFSYSKFRKRYEEPIVRSRDTAATERLRQLVRPFMLRRLKSDVLAELPPKTETILRSDMEGEQKKLYRATLAEARQELDGVTGEGRFAVLAALTRMRQVCCDPALLFEDYGGGSVKLEACMELVQSCVDSGRRMLLFSQFTSMLEIIAGRLEQLGIAYYRLEGSTKPVRRVEMVNAFNADETPVFLISLKAGGTGLNLTGADVVIHYDPWWNLSAQNQATDRAHRIGQKKSVQVYKLIVRDTVEERILRMQLDKASLADSIVREGGDVFEKMSYDELLALFEE